jgi:hypothetical protein
LQRQDRAGRRIAERWRKVRRWQQRMPCDAIAARDSERCGGCCRVVGRHCERRVGGVLCGRLRLRAAAGLSILPSDSSAAIQANRKRVWALQPEIWRYFRTSKLVAHGAAFGPSDDAMRPYSSELLQIDLG